ncbi:MAG: hypothetical protein NZT92_16540 [Abditibacteriales bacterium]|nr:hypothetical protein [Abditibacteriales bacterium]MDW8367347.1 hypothetical protein [Abditibacteriales bacterium]
MDSLQTSSSRRSRGEGTRLPRWYRVLKWAAFYALCGAMCVRIGQAVALQQEKQMHAAIAAQKLERFRERKRQVNAELRALQMGKGLDKVFVENGFIREGERVFVLPKDPPVQPQVAAPSKSALPPRKPPWRERAAEALKRLWQR